MRIFHQIILLFISSCLFGQDVEFSASASPNVLRVGEQFNLTYSSNQELEEFDLPEIKDFELLGGPSQGHNQSVYSVNGKITTSSTYQYTYFFRAVKEGKFTISPASVKYKGKTYKSNTVNLEVIKASARPNPGNQGATNGRNTNPQGGQVNEKDLFVRLVLDKKQAYLGEQILATIKIYTKTNLAGIDQSFKGPDFTGFFTETVTVPPLRSLQNEVVDGDIYGTGILRKMVIIPQKTGELVIPSFELDVALRREVRRKFADPFFDDFSIPDIQEIPVKLKSKPVTVYVKPLPPNVPPSFKGAVGNFRITSSLSNSNATTNEPLTLKVAVSGRGNLKLINEVQVNVPSDMERYDPVINTHFDNPLSGSKTFEYLIVPKIPGEFKIDPVEFTYFDADDGRYKTLKTESYQIYVERGQGDSLMVASQGVNKEDVKLLNQDIRFIKTRTFKVKPKGSYLAYSPLYFLSYAVIIALFAGLLYLRREIIRQNADVAGLRLKRADKYARKRLKKCEILLKQGNDSAFFEEMLGAFWGYLSHKLNIPVSSLSGDSAKIALKERGVNEELIKQLFNIIEICEIARYGQHGQNNAKVQLYHEAVKVITALQQQLK